MCLINGQLITNSQYHEVAVQINSFMKIAPSQIDKISKEHETKYLLLHFDSKQQQNQ